jgi:AAA domain
MTTLLPDGQQIYAFMETYVAQARAATQGLPTPGVLQMIRIHPLDESIVIYRYALNDELLVQQMAKEACAASADGFNVYLEARTVRTGLGSKQRGGIEDTVSVFALVIDSDADKGKAWSRSVPVSLSVETSPCNEHDWLFFERAVDAQTGKALGDRLRAAVKADHDTGNIVQPYRIAGTVNYPNKVKIARGRTIAPTRMLGFDPETLWTPERFDIEFPPEPPKPNGGHAQDAGDMDEAGIPADTLEAIRNGVEDGLRSDVFWNVMVVLKRVGWTVDGITALLDRYPNGLARKYRGRLRHEVGRVWEKIGKKKQAAAGELKLTYFDELTEAAPKPWLIKNVIARGEASSWIAQPGKGKSALLIDIAIHLASGEDWRGHRTKSRCGVVFFALERADLVRRRLTAHKLRNKLPNLPIAVAGQVIDLMHRDCVDVILGAIRQAEQHFSCEVGLAIIDTYPKGIAAGGGDESSAKDQNIALANLRRVLDQAPIHIAGIGHTGKDESKGERGSNARLGDVDLLVTSEATRSRPRWSRRPTISPKTC